MRGFDAAARGSGRRCAEGGVSRRRRNEGRDARLKRETLPRTEERIFPPGRRPDDGLLAEHWARYRFASATASGRLLDLGCGTGYGSRELARSSPVSQVVGVDRSDEALALAARYYADPKVTYRKADLATPGWAGDLALFDGIIAFEVLEHLRDERAFWDGIARSLRANGTVWLSTPLGRGRGRPVSDSFHAHQLQRIEVVALFASGWDPRFYGQTGGWIEPWTPGRRYYTMIVRARRAA